MRFLLLGLLPLVWTTLAIADTNKLTSLESLDDGRAWMAVGRLSFQNGKQLCTATLVAPDLILTASHCLYDADTGQKLDLIDFEFQAGWRNGRAEAYSAISAAINFKNNYASHKSKLKAVPTDIALLKLSHPIRKKSIQPFPIAVFSKNQKSVSVVSYALGRIDAPSLQNTCDIVEMMDDMFAFDCEADLGASGAPVFYLSSQGPVIISVFSAVADVGNKRLVFGPIAEKSLKHLKRVLEQQE